MIVDRAIVKGLVEPITDGVIPAPSGEQRYFTALDEVSGQYIDFNTPASLNSSRGYRIIVELVPSESSGSNGFRLFRGDDLNEFVKIFDSGGSNSNLVRFRPLSSTSDFNGAMDGIDRSKLNKIEIVCTDFSSLELFINDVSKGVQATQDGEFEFKYINIQESTDLIVANVEIYDGTTLIKSFAINEEYTVSNPDIENLANASEPATIVNPSNTMSVLYTKLPNGNWQDAQGNILEVAF